MDTISKMKHHIRTSFGDSKTFYGGGEWTEDRGGNLMETVKAIQASKMDSNQLPLLTILKEEGYGIRFSSPMEGEEIAISAFGFVDDMDYIQTAEEGEPEQKLLHKTQNGMNLWESLLQTTGGAVVVQPGKTNWVNIAFEDKKGNLCLKPPQEDNNLTIHNTDGETVHIKQLHVKTAQKTLGVFQTITGNENSEVQYLLGKLQKWKENVHKSNLGHEDSRCAVSTTIGKY